MKIVKSRQTFVQIGGGHYKYINAFTLIELLAVIVILAILALIVSPIISGVISDAKKASAERSTEGYIKAVEYAQIRYQYKNKGSITRSIENLSISVQGIDKVTVTSIEFSTSGIVESATILVDGYTCNYSSGKAGCSKDNAPSTPVVNAKTSAELINMLKEDVDPESGLVADAYEPGRYYFRGLNPKNKLILQESTGPTPYRIISFEADGTIKVVREESIGKKAWDTSSTRNSTQDTYCTDSSNYSCNAWGNQYNTYRYGTLMNDYFSLRYYASNTATDMTIKGTETGNKTTVTKDSSLNTYLNSTYLTTNLEPIKDYIDEHIWDVGGVYLVTKDFKKDIDETKVNQWKGKIALPSIIDYKNASDNTTQCINIYSGFSKINGTSYYPCTQNSGGTVNNYLYKIYDQWSLSASSSSCFTVWNAYGSGIFSYSSGHYTSGVRPSLYLKSTIKLIGEGTTGKEFTIVES